MDWYSANNIRRTKSKTTTSTSTPRASSSSSSPSGSISSGSSNLSGMVVPGSPSSSSKSGSSNSYQGYVDLFTNPEAQSAWPFQSVQMPNGQYPSLSDAAGDYQSSINPPVVPEVPPVEQYDPTEYINQLKEAQRASRIAALDKAKTSALSSLDTEKANVAPTYYDKRNQAAAASDVGALNFAQYMAARGIKGAAGAMPEIYRQAGLQGQIGALDRQEASDMAGIERQRANVETGYASDVAAAEADVEAQAMQAAITQYNANRQYALSQAQLTGSLGDTRTLAGQEFDYSKSSSNPAVQAAILANRAQELNNAAQEIQNSYLPDTLKLQAQRLKQQVEAGALDYDTALAQLNQIKAQTANYGRSGSSGGLTAGQEESSRKAMNDWVTKQVLEDDRLLSDQSNFAQLYDAWKTMYTKMNYGG